MPIPDFTSGPDYESAFSIAIQKNAKDILNLLNKGDKGLAKKIKTYAQRTGRSVEEVTEAVRTIAIFRDVFTKDPSKQKFHEKTAAAFIESLPGVKDFHSLGHDAKVVFGGRVESRKDVYKGGASTTAKTIDFEWKYNGKQFYASHKYTKESGGAQDNQYRDLQEFIRQANESNLANTYFLALADGEYYSGRDRGSSTTKLLRLKSLANRQNTFAMATKELNEWLKSLLD